MKSKWIKCARRKKEMRANKSWLKFTADYKVYKMAAAASVRQQPLLELCECKSVYFCAWVCVHWPRVICLCRCRLRAHCWFFIKIINAAAFGRMQKCGLLNYFRKSQRATSCAGQIENASAKYVMIDVKSRRLWRTEKTFVDTMSRWVNALSGFARHSRNVSVAFFISPLVSVFGRSSLKPANEL